MGLEDFTIKLQPVKAQSVRSQVIVQVLTSAHFELLPPTPFHGGAQLAEPPHDEIYLTLNASSYVFEAQLKTSPPPGHYLHHLSLRFAICQPPLATDLFIELACDIALHHKMDIYWGSHKYAYSDLERTFPSEARERIDEQKERWRGLFAGDATEAAIPVNQAWSSFLERKRNLTAVS